MQSFELKFGFFFGITLKLLRNNINCFIKFFLAIVDLEVISK